MIDAWSISPYNIHIERKPPMEDRIQLTVRWAQQSADFMKVDCSEDMIARVVDSVHQLSDAEVEDFLRG